ncbi:cyclophilin-like protein, partial [Metschnikowia bicuspidata]
MGTIDEVVDKYVYFDISVGQNPTGRIVVSLYFTEAPKTCSHFVANLDKYQNTYFHRVVKNFMVQGGDVVKGLVENYKEGKAGTGSPYKHIEDENLLHSLDKSFLLCMTNTGLNTNGTQFFITTASAPHLQGKNTVFGEVIHGKSVVREIERVNTSLQGCPVESELPIITQCGFWHPGDPVPIYNACYDTIGGDNYEEYPNDDETITKGSLLSAFEAASVVKDSGGALFKKGEYSKAYLKYKKSLRYVMEYIPDIDQEPEHYKNFEDLKTKLYLNLCLVTLKLKDYAKCFQYGTYLLEYDLSTPEKAKTYYRMGFARLEMRKYDEARKLLKSAHELASDPSIERVLNRAEDALKRQKEAQKS